MHHILTYMEFGKAVEFLGKSAAKIIKGRRLESDHSALVSFCLRD